MFNNKFTHTRPVEESRESTTFEGSLQSKMSQTILDKDIRDLLIAKKWLHNFNLMKGASVILRKEPLREVVDNADAFENPNESNQ